jgi:hypothetical protein
VDVADLVQAAEVAARAEGMRRVPAALRAPLAHFLALGAVLAAGRAALPDAEAGPPRVIRVTPALVDALTAHAGAPALETWLDDEVLFREGLRQGLGWNPSVIGRLVHVGRFVGDGCGAADDATVLADVRRLGLDRDDPVVRAQVAGRMRLRLRAEVMRDEPADADLERWLAAHPERFVRPARATFAHVFVRGADARPAAQAIADRIRTERLPVARALRLGDAFREGERFRARSRPEIEAILGAAVAAAAMTAPEGAWSAPVRSPYGWHLVRVETRTPDGRFPLTAVRDQVRRAWAVERAERLVAARIAALRSTYRVERETASR